MSQEPSRINRERFRLHLTARSGRKGSEIQGRDDVVLVDGVQLRARRAVVNVEPHHMCQASPLTIQEGEAFGENGLMIARPLILTNAGRVVSKRLTARGRASRPAPDELDGIVVAGDRRPGRAPKKRAPCSQAVVEEENTIEEGRVWVRRQTLPS